MNKKKFYYAEAERLYIEEQMTIEEIADRFHLAVRTVKYWKDGNNWNGKRKKFLGLKQKYLKDFDVFVSNMLFNLSEDQHSGRKTSSGRLYSFARQMDTWLKFKNAEINCKKFMEKYPDFGREKSREQKTTLSPEEIRELRREFLGMKD